MIAVTAGVPLKTWSRLSYRPATAQYCFHLLTHRSTALRRQYWASPEAGGRGRPPGRVRLT